MGWRGDGCSTLGDDGLVGSRLCAEWGGGEKGEGLEEINNGRAFGHWKFLGR